MFVVQCPAAADRAGHQLGAGLVGQHRPGIERVEQDGVLADLRAHDEVPGQADAGDLESDAPADLHEHQRQRDRDAEAAVEDLVQAAVAGVVVRLGVAAEAFFLEQELPEPMQATERVVRPRGA